MAGIHPPYSPDIAPSDFHLFWSLQNSLNGKNFNSLEDRKMHLVQFFAQKDKMFWEDGIMKLPEKWQKVVEQNSEYVFVCLFVLVYLTTPRSMHVELPRPGIEPVPPAVEGQSLNHWTTGEVHKMVNMLFNKVLGENEECVFYFYLKTEGSFWPTQ